MHKPELRRGCEFVENSNCMDVCLFLIFFYSLKMKKKKKMEVGERICQAKEVKGSRVLFGVVSLQVCCDYL